MKKITPEQLAEIKTLAAAKKEEILNSKSSCKTDGTVYYVNSKTGSDDNNGLTPETAFASLDKASNIELNVGDTVLFCRGEVFRGLLKTQPGVTYSAYGEGVPHGKLDVWNGRRFVHRESGPLKAIKI